MVDDVDDWMAHAVSVFAVVVALAQLCDESAEAEIAGRYADHVAVAADDVGPGVAYEDDAVVA